MMAFWALLGSAAGVKTAQGLWHLLAWDGELAIAVPVGAVVGAGFGALLGLITRPHLLVLLMAVSAGGVAGQIIWGEIGQFCGQAGGALIGAAAWAAWLFLARARDLPLGSPVVRGTRRTSEYPPPAQPEFRDECYPVLSQRLYAISVSTVGPARRIRSITS